MKKLTVVILALVLAGCQTYKRLPEAESQVTASGANYEVTVPGGWVQFSFADKGEVIITKDGLSLQHVEFRESGLDKPFQALEVKLSETVLINEVADHYIEDFKARVSGATVEKRSLAPTEIANADGFKMRLNAVTSAGLEYDILVYGLIKDKKLYTMSYQAPTLYFFDKELNEFEVMASSFQLLK